MHTLTWLAAPGLFAAIACSANDPASEPVGGPSPLAVEARAAVERSLPLLQGSMDVWIGEQACISCHHQGLGTMAVVMARERGLAIDQEFHRRQVQRLLEVAPGGSLHGDAGINGTFGRSFQMLALGAAGAPRDARTDAVAYFLAGNFERAGGGGDMGMWRTVSYRPPLEASEVTGTAFALRAIDLYAPDARAGEMRATIARARRWLEVLEPRDAEERAMRLFGLGWAGASAEQIQGAADAILRAQRPDGGWAQLATMDSDAYATGQALVALQQMARVPVDAPAHRRGVRFLLERQLADGSWLVETRRRGPGLPYFETGFPHKLHQFISTAATAWATMALCGALDPAPSQAFAGPRPARGAEGAVPGLGALHRAAAFGTPRDLRRALGAGADANEPGSERLTPLHLAVRSPAMVEMLLDAGAEVDARTEYGATPLVLAAWYDGGEAAAELFLARGADPNARAEEDGMTPLMRAARSGKHALVRRLLAAGADLEATDAMGSTALHWAATGGDCATAELLLAAGARTEARCFGSTALHYASHDGDAEMVSLLLAHGADPDATDEGGMTPVGWAAKVEHGDVRTLEALLAGGADASIPATNGRTPLDWARYFENELAVTALEARVR